MKGVENTECKKVGVINLLLFVIILKIMTYYCFSFFYYYSYLYLSSTS